MNDFTARHAATTVASTARLMAGLATALAISLSGCGGGGDNVALTACTVTSVTVGASPASIALGGTTTLSATLDATAACATGLTWSATPAGGTLAPSGATATFTSGAANTYTITATSVADPTKSGSATVTVNPAPPVCTVTGVTVAATPATTDVGGTSSLSATLTATAACAGGLTWSVSPTAGATLTPSGATAAFTASIAGTYTVTATSVDDGSRQGQATITVNPVTPVCTVTGVTVAAAPASFVAGGTSSLSATVAATAACGGAVTWSVLPPTGGTLTPNGLAASFASSTPGTYTVTARSVDDTSKSGSAVITVDPVPPVCTVSGVTVTATPTSFVAGGTSSLSAAVSATAACTGAVTWSVLPPSGGTLTPNGLAASFASSTPGTYTVTARSVDDTSKSGSAVITVTAVPPVCTVSSVTVTATPTSFVAGGTSSLSAAVSASAACTGAVTWSVVPPTGGTLTPSGLTASFASSTAGTYTVTARSADDTSKSGSAVITVTAAPPPCFVTGVSVAANPATFEAGGSSALTATVTATAQCTRALTWTVSPQVGGTLTPTGLTASFSSSTAGTYVITATNTEDGTKQGQATITVTPALPCTVSGVTVVTGPAAISTGGTSILSATVTASQACTRAVTWSASGGTVTPNGAKAAFTAVPQTTYTVTATSVDDGNQSGSATVTVGPAFACGTPNGSVVSHPGGTVVTADETWVGDGVTHSLPGSVQIEGTATVTIQPCAIVSMGSIGSILVQGSGRLVSAGTGGGNRFVEIVSASNGVKWGMISASAPALVDLRFTNVREGGETVGLPMLLRGVGAGDGAPPTPVLRVQSVEISGSGGLGISLEQNGTFTADSANLTIKDSAGFPLRANLVALGTLPAGDYTLNGKKEGADEIVVHGPGATLSTDMTIKRLGVPYRFEVPFVQVQPVAPSPGPVTLTIESGVTLKFPRRVTGVGQTAPGALFSVGTAGLTPNGVGVLNAVGAPGAPIVFTSGQDLPLADPPISPAAGDWQGLWLATAAGSQLENVEIRYAGAPITFNSGNCRPVGSSDAAALLIGNLTDQFVPPATLLTSSTIADSAGHGINAVWEAATASSGPDLTPTNTFQNLNGCRQTFNGVPGSCPVGGGCTAP